MAARQSIRVSAALRLETLRAPVIVERIKFRGFLINGDVPHAYESSNIVSILV
jgi:hypothetical protein